METIHFLTEDRVRIAANYWQGQGEKGIILLHMMPATKESWNALAQRLADEGCDVLAIDLRGHGESVETREGGGELDYRGFTDEEHQASRLDVEAAARWLAEEKDISPDAIAVGGASIGANLALGYMVDHVECLAGFLLSPGANYRGLDGVELAHRLSSLQRVLVVASKDDGDGKAHEEAAAVHDALSSEKAIKIFDAGGHGTDLLLSHPELAHTLTEWLLADIQS